MALCAEITVDGFVKSTNEIAETCIGILLISPSEYSMNYQIAGVSSADFAAVLAGSFGFVLAAAAVAWKVSVAVNLTKKI